MGRFSSHFLRLQSSFTCYIFWRKFCYWCYLEREYGVSWYSRFITDTAFAPSSNLQCTEKEVLGVWLWVCGDALSGLAVHFAVIDSRLVLYIFRLGMDRIRSLNHIFFRRLSNIMFLWFFFFFFVFVYTNFKKQIIK